MKLKRILMIMAAALPLLGVAACASPTMKMSDAQIMALSDDRLCSYKNNYREEPRLNAELDARGLGPLECNRFYRACLKNGHQPQTQAMDFCMATLRENERLRDSYRRYDDRAFLYGMHGYGTGRRVNTGLGVGFGF